MDKAHITLRTQWGISQLAKGEWNLMNTAERIQFEKEVGLDAGQDYDLLSQTDVNWRDMVFNDNAMLQNYDLSINRATERLNYFVSGSFYDQDGIAQGSTFRRYSMRANAEVKASNQDTVSASITAGDYLFRASGFRVSFDGFTALYEESTDDAKKKETALPPLEEGQTLKLKKLTADQKFTQPPPLYTEATLIHALEENGIGRPSTYAPIITTIVDRGYVEKDQKKLKTTPLGQAVNTVMMEQFPDIVNVKFSADMEKKLDVVEAGQADWVKTIDDFYQGFEKSLEQAEKNMEGKRIKVEDIPTDEICEKCGRPMVIKSGRYGKFVACSGFPECRNAHPLVKDTGGLCPLDGGHMLVRKSAKGRVYYGCSNYPKCNYMTWDEPVPEKCPQCGSTLFKKKGQLYCAKEGCGFVKAIEKK